MKAWQSILFGTFLGLAASAVIVLVVAQPRGEPLILPAPPTTSLIVVQVSGAVVRPGLVSLPRQSRVMNAIEAAGGFSTDADQEAMNLAARVGDGERIQVPSISARGTQAVLLATQAILDPKGKNAAPTATLSVPVNINTAPLEVLEKLPNIGPTRAEAIVAYRQQHGDFKKIEDLQNVTGIGPSIFEKVKVFITVGN